MVVRSSPLHRSPVSSQTDPGSKMAPSTLVIGYGNTLRGDDGVGYRIAEAVMEWDLPTVRVLACHQLTPELAEAIAQVERVVFVDAAIADLGASPQVTLEPLTLEGGETFTTHSATPSALLALTQWLYQVTPDAFQLTVPALDFDLGETFSPTTSLGQTLALEKLQFLLAGEGSVPEV